ncbi:tetratricopeptide (TPR) repeat protein [Kitasatospora sp. GP30]|uniref:transcriptional regulator n=1 Tax=Kitasatospora sp. GP30 TaxID=3035084 RepID=UPI000C70BBC6|nr:transcriptional regulator [Kitasatospora sp. GP30]MDH6139030.1 tetratricopeptide (TPR) repeat protein [Kitasatospora sp. GP30]
MSLRLDTAFAELALRTGGDTAALAVFRRVLAADPPPDPATAWRAHRGQAWALEKLGRLEEAITEYRELLVAPEAVPGSADWALLTVALCRCYRDVGDHAMSIDLGERALRELAAAEAEPIHEHLQLGSTLMGCYVVRGDLTSAKLLAEQLLPLAERADSRVARGAVEWNRSVIAREQGRLADALELAERALVLMAEADNERHQGMLRVNLATVLLAGGEPCRSVELLATAHPILADHAQLHEAVFAMALHAEALVQLGEPDAALDWVARGRARLDGGGQPHWYYRAQLALAAARARLLAGQDGPGEAELRGCAALLGRAASARPVAVLWRQLGDVWAERQQAEEAMTAYQTALTVLGLPAAPVPVSGRRRALS